MKKLYMLGLLVIAASTTGCTLKAPTMPILSTGKVQEITGTTDNNGTAVNVPSSAMEEFTGEIDSGVVPTVTGSEDVHANTGVTSDVKTLIDQRKSQPEDTTKLNEEDISLMEQIIQKIQNIGK